MKSKTLFIFILILFFTNHVIPDNYPKRELRGAWIATVGNIDWPSTPAETSGEQIRELVSIFQKLKEAGINTVYFQVRTECDALYKSSYEPWSYWLTGKQAQAPDPYYDPLAFAIEEAHSRGMELHAWINPYRAIRDTADYKISENHISKTHPEWILQFGNNLMLNPGIPAVTEYITTIIADIAKRYNADGIHLDDYFYPYTPKISVEDSETFRIYKGKFSNIDDWRRNNINSMISEVQKTIKEINPMIKFGVSPFGIVKNEYANTNGFSSYSSIYCDPLTWIKEKTVDYIAPQLYWNIGNKSSDFKKLLPWWSSTKDGRDIYIGLFSSKFTGPEWDGNSSELYNEIRMTREYKNIDGVIFFSAKSIFKNYSGMADSLKNSLFKYPALIPEMDWKNSEPPSSPSFLTVAGNDSSRILQWGKPMEQNSELNYVVYRFNDNEKIDMNNPKNILSIIFNDTTYSDTQFLGNIKKVLYFVSSLNKSEQESFDYAAGSLVLKK